MLAQGGAAGAAAGPIELVFGHNDLLAANLIDDGRRLWLVDWDYGGWNSPLFDLGGLASNSELPDEEAMAARAYFERPLDDRLRRLRRHEMRLAPARGHVEHGLRDLSRLDFDYVAYTPTISAASSALVRLQLMRRA